MKRRRRKIKKLGIVFSSFMTLMGPGIPAKMLEKTKEGKSEKRCRGAHHVSGSDDEEGDIPPWLRKVLWRPPGPLASGWDGSQEAADPSLLFRPGAGDSAKHHPPMADVAHFDWRCQIPTTVFWIGEKATVNNRTPNHKSSWDEKWAQNYGGTDDPKKRRGFLPAGFTPRQNPFYVALPYNDLCAQGHKGEARTLIPWFRSAYAGRYKSVCKGRWIAIRKGGRVCYAQWEDAGPFVTDDADYVFGNARPKNSTGNHGAGLDVSPAVRDYLGLDGEDITDWRFAEVDEIPQGPWADHGDNNTFVMNRRQEEREALAMTEPVATPASHMPSRARTTTARRKPKHSRV